MAAQAALVSTLLAGGARGNSRLPKVPLEGPKWDKWGEGPRVPSPGSGISHVMSGAFSPYLEVGVKGWAEGAHRLALCLQEAESVGDLQKASRANLHSLVLQVLLDVQELWLPQGEAGE